MDIFILSLCNVYRQKCSPKKKEKRITMGIATRLAISIIVNQNAQLASADFHFHK